MTYDPDDLDAYDPDDPKVPDYLDRADAAREQREHEADLDLCPECREAEMGEESDGGPVSRSWWRCPSCGYAEERVYSWPSRVRLDRP